MNLGLCGDKETNYYDGVDFSKAYVTIKSFFIIKFMKMDLKSILSQWDAENPAGKVVLNTQTIHAALGDPLVMAHFDLSLPESATLLSDIEKALVDRFGGERDRSVNLRDIASMLELMEMPQILRTVIKNSLISLG